MLKTNWLNALFSNASSDPLAIAITDTLGFKPNNIKPYYQAFSHSSMDSDKYGNNERLEFLGDALLQSAITEYLYESLPHKNEGVLTDIRSKIVSRKTLNHLGQTYALDRFIQSTLSKPLPPSVVGNAFEALIAAIHIDKGSAFCKQFIIKTIETHFDLAELEQQISSYKKHFIHWAQKNNIPFAFELLSEEGESHNKQFEIALYYNGSPLSKATSGSKKKAEESAAKKACEKLAL